jgi:MoaA/NifB/PqqE/SkfB family radical SAM enzyme
MTTVKDIQVPTALAGHRRVALDEALLLFDRQTGSNALCTGAETAGLRQMAPRAIQFAITNRCNLACGFCSRDTGLESRWTAGSAFELLRDLDRAGAVEVAFGGGEPTIFPGFAGLVERLHGETSMAIGFTTNGLLFDAAMASSLRGCVSQVRISLYDDKPWSRALEAALAGGVRVGVNWLVTPERLPRLEDRVLDLVTRGCRDVLILCYKGSDSALHLDRAQTASLSQRMRLLARGIGATVSLKLDICWGERLEAVPQLLRRGDCGAGRDFLVVTSDRRMQPCSFHQLSIPFTDAADLLRIWAERREELAAPANRAGCARLPDNGMQAERMMAP